MAAVQTSVFLLASWYPDVLHARLIVFPAQNIPLLLSGHISLKFLPTVAELQIVKKRYYVARCLQDVEECSVS